MTFLWGKKDGKIKNLENNFEINMKNYKQPVKGLSMLPLVSNLTAGFLNEL